MATIKRREDRGNRWEVRFRDPEGKQRARLFDRRVDAEQFITGTEHSKLTGTYVDPALGRTTFARFVAEDYRPTMVGLEPSTRMSMRKRLAAVGLGLGLVLSPALMAPASADDHRHVMFCRQAAEHSPESFEQIFGSHGGCVSHVRSSLDSVEICKNDVFFAILQERYDVEFDNQGYCVSWLNERSK